MFDLIAYNFKVENEMNQDYQDQYAAKRMGIQMMLDEIMNAADNFKNPEEATYTDYSELNRLEAEVRSIYHRVTETGEYKGGA